MLVKSIFLSNFVKILLVYVNKNSLYSQCYILVVIVYNYFDWRLLSLFFDIIGRFIFYSLLNLY